MMCLSEGESIIQQQSRKRKFEDPDANMVMLDDEHNFARQLKAARREDEVEIDPLSDLAYAQHAIKSLGLQKEEVLFKVQGMRNFMRKYGVQDTPRDAMKCLGDFFDRYPGILLKIDRCGSLQEGIRYFAVLDLAAILQAIKAAVGSEQDKATLLAGLFYVSQCLFPHTSAMRGGTTVIFECGGVNWDDFNKENDILQVWQDLYCCYPMNFRDAWFYNTTDKGTHALTLLGLKTLSEETMQRIYLGCQMELEGRPASLNDIFSWSSQEKKRTAFLDDAERLLTLRYQSEKNFNL